MFECGLENISLKAAKRSGYKGIITSENSTTLHLDQIFQDKQKLKQHQRFSKKVGYVIYAIALYTVDKIQMYCKNPFLYPNHFDT